MEGKGKEGNYRYGIWSYSNFAMSNEIGVARFTKQGKDQKVGPGFEGGKINAKSSEGYDIEEVNMTKVDDFLDMHAIKKLDILKIDAEGHDNAVIAGAMGAIENNVSMFVFEGYGWLTTDMISTFDNLGFSCYSSSRAGLFKWNANCMPDKIVSTRKEKGNVYCASRRRAPMVTLAFDGLSFPVMLDELRRESKIKEDTFGGTLERDAAEEAKDASDFGQSFINWKSFCTNWPSCAMNMEKMNRN